MPPLEDAAPAAEQAPAEQSFGSIAADVNAALEAPADDDGQGSPAPVVADEDNPEGVGKEGADEGADGEQAKTDDEVVDALASMKREDVPENLLGIYDEIVNARKQMQADYTRKTQALADDKRTIPEQVEALVNERLAELGVKPQSEQQEQPVAPSQEDYDANLWAGLGEPITLEMVSAAEGPEVFNAYLQQQIRLAARQELLVYDANRVAPQLNSLGEFASRAQTEAADAQIQAFAVANPDLAAVPGGVIQAFQLLNAGIATSLEDAAEKARNMVLGPQRIQQATELGLQAGRSRAETVSGNKERYSVPSSGTAPRTAPGSEYVGQGFGGVADLLKQNLGNEA